MRRNDVFVKQTGDGNGGLQTSSEAARTKTATRDRSESMVELLEAVRNWDDCQGSVLQTGAAGRHLGSLEKKADGGADYPRQGPESYSKRRRSKKRKNLS